MSGGEACISVEPSRNSTIECTTDCGWTTTSMRSSGRPNSRWASTTSRPLFTSVALLTVTSGPIDQVGWASASAGVTSASSARVQPRNGPPDAVSTSRRTSSARPPRRHCARAECSESTGTIWPGSRSGPHQRAADDQRLLVGEREGATGVQRGERRGQAGRAGHRVEHDVRAASRPARSPPADRPGPWAATCRRVAQPAAVAEAYSASWRSLAACARPTATTSTPKRHRLLGEQLDGLRGGPRRHRSRPRGTARGCARSRRAPGCPPSRWTRARRRRAAHRPGSAPTTCSRSHCPPGRGPAPPPGTAAGAARAYRSRPVSTRTRS